jgi:hypothetical protein
MSSNRHRPVVPIRGLPNDQIAELIDGFLLASVADDPAGVRTELDAAVFALGLGGCVDDVLLPAMREIGARWQHGLFGIDSERLPTETVLGWLEGCALGAPEPHPRRTLLLACGPSDRHSIGLEALGVLLRYQQQPCRMLGPRTSARTLAVAAMANQPSGVVVASHLRSGRLGATQALRSVTGLGLELFYAGGAFATGRLRRHVPGTYLGTNIQAACAAILATISHEI